MFEEDKKILDDELLWTRVERKVRVNDLALGPWESADVDDNLVRHILKKRFISETISFIIFEILVVITCLVGIVVMLAVYDDTIMAFIIAILAAVTVSSLAMNISDIQEKIHILDNKEYSMCDCIAFGVDGKRKENGCFVKDLNGNVLLEQTAGSEAAPKAVFYYSYFSDDDYSGRLLKVRNGKRGILFLFFPTNYLKQDDESI